MRRPQSSVVSPFGARIACGTRFGTLPGSVLGAFWPSKWLKTVLESVSERPRAVQVHLFSSPEASESNPRGLQERSKRPPGALQEACESPGGSKMRPRALQGAIWTSPGTPEPLKSSPIEQTRAESSSRLSAVAGTAGRQLDTYKSVRILWIPIKSPTNPFGFYGSV